MLRALCVYALLAATLAHDGSDNGDDSSDPVTVTPAGTIRGSWMSTRRGRRFQAYRGVRYAHPPTGELRFQPPKPILQYDGAVDASEEGPACPQPVATEGFVVDEDCLRLNVYTPRTNGSLPVVVYLHAGGFYSGSGRSDLAGPHYLLERDLVLVAINYRLATLGFLATGDEFSPGNNGFKDQVAALRWVRRNIAALGGDPGRVTVAGYSAGSLSIGLLMLSPMAKGLFHGAIAMSASPISQVVVGSEQRYLGERQARLLGCPTNTTRDMVSCLKTKPWKEFGDSLDSMFEFGYDPVLMWNVVVEPDYGQERFLTEPPLDALRAGRLYAVPYVVSQTTDEFFWKAFNVLNNETLYSEMSTEWERVAPISFMLPEGGQDEQGAGGPVPATTAAQRLRDAYFDAPFANDSSTADALGKLYSDGIIGFGVHRMANLMCRHSPQPVFYYQFAYVGNHSHYQDPTTGKPTGTAHHDDLIYLFTLPAVFPRIELGTPDDVIVQRMTTFWYNFITHGDPVSGSTADGACAVWPAMTPRRPRYLRVARDCSLHQHMFRERYQVWDDLYPIQYD
ncbi:juvenile hormone esterase-like [Pectinophora gossypiella]|uniref:juvenile hormone esterase-like n=1 Tax=Pectinophora gossypiella TaxID=13191 RepID=UPI00214EC53B|nr:juvenile hormone esterase-like [Pectinophora gossypiella]